MRPLARVLRLVTAAAVNATSLVAPLATAQPVDAATAKHFSVTVTRSYLDRSGTSHTTDTRHVHLTVSQTTNLRGRQEIDVSWSGAHPTGGLISDVNSGDAANEEYPFVLLECRGVDSTSVPAAKRISPETCWTQTWSERFEKDSTNGYPSWRVDRYASAPDRAAIVDAPKKRPAACFAPALAERWVPFVSVKGTVYPGGSVGCGGMAPEAANVGGAGIPSNATYGITAADGSGSTQFDVWTADENASLGCSNTVPCSLVAIPIEGISCDAYGTRLPAKQRTPSGIADTVDSDCRETGAYKAGQIADPGIAPDLSVSGALWWSASNWRNRITVPLQFAPPPSICSVVSKDKPVAIYGSVLMTEATAQWEPKFCTTKNLYPFVHVQTADGSARSLLTAGSIDAAFSSRVASPGFGRPVVQAPVAVTGFAISYEIDDAKGNRYTSLKLDPRLLAKLLTESYPADSLVQQNDPALAKNPVNITQDPEFQALNPGLPKYLATEAAATIINTSSEADLVWALTSYIESDPEARAWLDGKPDPWGMVVNPAYKGIKLPVDSWPLLDTFTLPKSYIDSENNPCYSYSPSPYLSLVANPPALMSTIVQDIQFGISDADIACPNGDPNDVSTLRLQVQGRQQPGFRFVLGVTSLSAAYRYDLSTAALQTGPVKDSGTTFTDAAGRTFVKPSVASLHAAAALLERKNSSKTWAFDYSKLGAAASSGAYPGTMPVYADIPTSGLPATTAAHLATFLRYAVGDGQRAGLVNGDLPPGYLPLTSAEGLGGMRTYTLAAADAVAAQRGAVPQLDAKPAPPQSSATSTSSGGHSGSQRDGGSGGIPALPPVGVPTAPSDTSTSSAAPSSGTPRTDTSTSPAPQPSTSLAAERTTGTYSRLGSLGLPLVIVLGLVALLVGGVLRYPGAPRLVAVRARGLAKHAVRRR